MRYIFLLFSLCACLSTAQAQELHVIESGNFFYNPSSLTINVGDTIRWINVGGFHNVNANINTLTGASYGNPDAFVSVATSDSELLTKVFTLPGVYNYDCSVGSHAANGMVASFTVVDNTTSTENVQEEVINALNVIYDPSARIINVNFNLNNSSDNASIRISNLAGSNLRTEKINAQAGRNEHQVDFNVDVPYGIYLVSLYVDGAFSTQKIFIQ
ncbi:MAG: plastocyanin/azurin family copper-binding protein [Bacteroidota bacterium]